MSRMNIRIQYTLSVEEMHIAVGEYLKKRGKIPEGTTDARVALTVHQTLGSVSHFTFHIIPK